MRELHLTSPLMSGNDVQELQMLLVQNGVYPASVDGEYGDITAQAVYRYKYRIGYRKPDKTAGDLIMQYLRGTKKPNAAMNLRAKMRARKKQNVAGWREKVVQHALSQLGETEHPADSNRSKFSLWYGIIGPWCAMFITWVFVTMSIAKKTFVRAVRYAYCPYVVHDAREGRNGLSVAVAPANAILGLFDWNGDHIADHIGMCAEEATIRKYAPEALKRAIAQFGPLGTNDFWSIEGNTGVGNDSNGGKTMIRKRNRSQVQLFAKVSIT